MKINVFFTMLMINLLTYAQDKNIIYQKKISDINFKLIVPVEDMVWKPINLVGVDMALNNDDQEIQAIFGATTLKNASKNQYDYLKTFVNSFNKEYDMNKGVLSFTPSKSVIKFFYDDDKSKFIVYCFYYKDYFIYSMIYSISKERKKQDIENNLEAQLDRFFFEASLKINESKIK